MSVSFSNINNSTFSPISVQLAPIGKVPFSRIRITASKRIFLMDYGNQELVLQPLMKSLYILYLKHPEGISLYDLVDYETELLDIYSSISNLANLHVLRNNIKRLIDRQDNSINEKISRIRAAVRKVCPAGIADLYCIRGPRGQAKRIQVDYQFIQWS